ncbi:branched-chain amino acid ABC transporter permease [Ferrovibrio sp.]|uniref:branched-chain amino acid ABC transporter permease n=1 Tax=Ferrovibrio sp. TaxID=1917215 RepID=UPI000CA6892B|nr:branched-chain amino acid ABC transporter permease [Ferrovibrio sp.]PJI38928.1 MAG: branched-chain amino acid ABC transporter [Ferrovibrio sp.]
MIARLLDGVPKRALILLGLLLAFLLVAPLFVGNYILSVLILVLYFAYTGQAWNVMMGFAGQLSLGHSLYVGLGAYTAAALYVHFGIGPWAGVWIAILISMAAGLVVGFLAFRFGIGGVYFALLTIAFAEFTRVGFDHFMWVNGSGGFFLPVAQYSVNDVLNLRGSPTMFYYILLGITVLAFIFCRWLLTGRIGYYWLAIREEPEAAQTLGINIFRCKMIAVAISSGMTALSGVFFAFYYNNLFPEQIFSMNRSIELILGPIIGGVGSLFGPILGAFVLTALAEVLNDIMVALGYELPGVKLLFYGFCLLIVVMWLPNGIWPPLRKWLRLGERL